MPSATYILIYYFQFGYLRSRVYFNRPNNLEHLRQRIRAEMEQISPDTTSTLALNFIVRTQLKFLQ
jgi:hypothetical protein